MTGAVDANVLLYASDESSPLHPSARDFVRRLAEGPGLVYLFWPSMMAYLRISTHPSIFADPLEPREAIRNVEALLRRPHVRTGSETERFWEVWRATVGDTPARGNAIPDSHVIALMHEHGVRTIYSRDRGLRRFQGIEVVDPFDS